MDGSFPVPAANWTEDWHKIGADGLAAIQTTLGLMGVSVARPLRRSRRSHPLSPTAAWTGRGTERGRSL
jgi:hypothetical protein